MYKNKLVRRATHASVRVYARGGVTTNSNVSRISIDSLSLRRHRSYPNAVNGRPLLYIPDVQKNERMIKDIYIVCS